MKKIIGTSAFALVTSALVIGPASAQDYPNKPVTAVIQMAPGGPTDLIVRVIQQKMGEELGQALIIENKAGAGGLIGIKNVLSAHADGYTLGIATGSSHGVAPNIYENLPYNPTKDFRPVGTLVMAPGVLVASKAAVPDCRYETFIKKLKENPGEMKYGSAGIGTLAHMTGAYFLAETETDMLHIPYRGLGPAMIDLQGGSIDALFDNISSARAHLKGGKICALAIQSDKRLEEYPSIPTYAELGLPQLNKPTWYGLIARAETPDAVILELNAALNKTLDSESVANLYKGMGVQPFKSTPEEFSALMQEENEFWKNVTEKINFAKLKL
ncbi:tripartite tricarboxylate transporter substrate binding protein [Pusillimonas sp. ANT_WB101]|uniref:Bug family tripartite tricarboxylate transporter substrate binding protein n=1 Tax=Pusillimonas sp. ANT_WB101 TaxID=2597356 RepID=UPI002104C31E|nr:tripartite tricarboxylate transporter substrate-binding protein [Pusillimonas sp. ANT_WB101]